MARAGAQDSGEVGAARSGIARRWNQADTRCNGHRQWVPQRCRCVTDCARRWGGCCFQRLASIGHSISADCPDTLQWLSALGPPTSRPLVTMAPHGWLPSAKSA